MMDGVGLTGIDLMPVCVEWGGELKQKPEAREWKPGVQGPTHLQNQAVGGGGDGGSSSSSSGSSSRSRSRNSNGFS